MKRRRPIAHYRIINTKRGKKRILINKDLNKRKRKPIEFAKASKIISNLRNDNLVHKKTIDRLREKLNEPITLEKRQKINNEIFKLKRDIIMKGERIDWLNKNYFFKRRLKGLLPIAILVIAFLSINSPTILHETKQIDYNTNNIQEIAKYIESISSTDYQKIANTADYVKNKVQYKFTGPVCFSQSASSVLDIQKGDCVSMSKLDAAILSAMDIPVKIVEGCVFRNLGGREGESFFDIPLDPYVKLPEGQQLNRKGPSNGQLHNWLRAYDGNQWLTIETTAGAVFPMRFEEQFGYDVYSDNVDPNNPYDLCLLQDDDYVKFCATH